MSRLVDFEVENWCAEERSRKVSATIMDVLINAGLSAGESLRALQLTKNAVKDSMRSTIWGEPLLRQSTKE